MLHFPEDDGFPSDETLDLWDEYQDAVVSIRHPVTWEEAEILIKCCPTDHMAGIEWSLLHCTESCCSLTENPDEVERYKSLISECNSDMMREELLKRLNHTFQNTPNQFDNSGCPSVIHGE